VIRETLAGQPEKEVVFRIHISREEVLETYRDCDVFVCSSKSEIYPIVAHEAAAAAMPIISTDVGMYRQISGACIVNGTGEMTSAMEKLYHHPEERARRGGEAYEWVCGQGCRIQDKVDWLEQDLLGLLAGKTGYRKEINMKY
jgi:glycosyltransferase involved in cell wall biosynthesis